MANSLCRAVLRFGTVLRELRERADTLLAGNGNQRVLLHRAGAKVRASLGSLLGVQGG